MEVLKKTPRPPLGGGERQKQEKEGVSFMGALQDIKQRPTCRAEPAKKNLFVHKHLHLLRRPWRGTKFQGESPSRYNAAFYGLGQSML